MQNNKCCICLDCQNAYADKCSKIRRPRVFVPGSVLGLYEGELYVVSCPEFVHDDPRYYKALYEKLMKEKAL